MFKPLNIHCTIFVVWPHCGGGGGTDWPQPVATGACQIKVSGRSFYLEVVVRTVAVVVDVSWPESDSPPSSEERVYRE